MFIDIVKNFPADAVLFEFDGYIDTKDSFIQVNASTDDSDNDHLLEFFNKAQVGDSYLCCTRVK